MKTTILSAASALVIGICLASAPVSAMPTASPLGVSGGVDGATHVRWRRHHHYRHHRHQGNSRRAAPSQAGNAKDPSRPIQQQNQGMTTGGPRN